MKIQRTTLILILLALGLGGFVYIYEIQGASQREQQKTQQQQLFKFTDDDIQRLTISKPDTKIILERNNKDNPKWLLTSPVTEPANNASVSYLVDLLTTGKSDRTFNANPSQLSEYGLDKPTATIDIELKNQKRHQVSLGKANFNDTFLYAKTDAPNTVLLVSKDFSNAVNRQLDEWKQPPEPLPSPTFSPSPGQ